MRIHHSSRPCGIVHVQVGSGVYLPLERVEVHADVIDVSSVVTVSQQFWQPSPEGLTQARYVFPVPSRAAVCGFEMTAEDGRVITAVVKEREEARREHQAAISQGLMTGLVEHVTDDVFSLSLGALPGQQVITTKITYVLDLMEDDATEQVRLQLPMYIGMRFGQVPLGLLGARMVPPDRVTISVDIRMQGAVKKVISPTHPMVLMTRNESTDHAAQAARYTSPDFMVRDFVLIVTAEGLDAPRCFAQRAPNGTVAMQLSVVPRFSLPPIQQQEYIFLVDRSGSMGGQRIETAKRALIMLLRSLPSTGTRFNIFSFGSQSSSLWLSSVEYDEVTISQATEHIDAMTANYGGTEMRSALEAVLRTRSREIASAIFVLTDGEAWDIDRTIQPISAAVTHTPANAPLRVFTLGIGETTSSALCEGMARAGNGICLMATTAETIIGKCSKLVRASRTYILKNVSVDWGVRTNVAENVFNTRVAHSTTLRQAPAKISAIYPGNRFVVFALLEDPSFTPPKEVVIRAQRDGEGEMLQYTVPVQVVETSPTTKTPPLVQTLAARRAIMDLEDSRRDSMASDVKNLIIHLGTQYQLASRFTSFIAVDKYTKVRVQGGPDPAPDFIRPNPPPLPRSGWIPNGVRPFGTIQTSQRRISQPVPAAQATFGAAPSSALSPPGAFAFGASSAAPPTVPAPNGHPPISGGLFGTPMQFSSASGSGALFGGSSQRVGPAQTPGGAFKLTMHAADDPMDTTNDIPPPPAGIVNVPVPSSTEERVVQLMRLQSFDGSFPPDNQLLSLLGAPLFLAEAKALGVSEKIWATALAITFLRLHMKDQPELLESLVEKAQALISRTPGVNEGKLYARAEAVLGAA